MKIPYITKCTLLNDDCLCDEEQQKICSNFQIVPDLVKIKENLNKKINQTNKLEEKVNEFVSNEKITPNQKIKVIKKEGKTEYITIESLFDKYNKFLRKNSLIKG